MSSSITIGGTTLHFENGSNVNIQNGKVIVNGKEIYKTDELRPIEVVIHGDVNNLKALNGVTVHGSVLGSVEAGNSIECVNIDGDARAGNSIYASVIKGKANAGKSIHY